MKQVLLCFASLEKKFNKVHLIKLEIIRIGNLPSENCTHNQTYIPCNITIQICALHNEKNVLRQRMSDNTHIITLACKAGSVTKRMSEPSHVLFKYSELIIFDMIIFDC